MAQAAAVNYYNHHLGDYDGATNHLSWDEDMAYTRLLRVYYRLEKPIPTDLKATFRLLRALTKTQRQAVERVLREFFELQDDGWHNKRADEEIIAYQQRIGQSRDAAAVRWHNARNARAMRPHQSGIANQPPTSNNQPPSTKGDGVDVSGLSKAVESPVDKKIEKTPEALRSLQNPAWLFSFDHAKLHARKLGIHVAGKTHQELKDAIAEHLKLPAQSDQQPKFAQSQ